MEPQAVPEGVQVRLMEALEKKIKLKGSPCNPKTDV
jgi:hypothetical protein